MKIWEALYNEMIYESSYATLSLHLSKEGAEKAIEKHKQIVKAKYKAKFNRGSWDEFKNWKIKETEVLP